MTTLLSARRLARALPQRTLFEGVCLHVDEGDRIGLIGPNGGGKSTLLRMIAGLEESDEGEITRRRGLRAAYVPQEDRFAEGSTVRDAALEEALARPIGERPKDPQVAAAAVLTRLGFADLDQPSASLSGGWRKRLSIARALATEPELLLLDEPTNHLDLEGVRWLQDLLLRASLAVIVVTHDRRFLEEVAGRVIELSAAYPGGTLEAKGNYSEFLRRRAEFLAAEQSAVASLANEVRRDDAWLRQGIQARRTRTQSSIDAAADRRRELADRGHRLRAPEATAAIEFQSTQRRTRRLVGLEGVGKSMGGRRLFADLELELSPGERLGLLGPNGAGKTTLLRIIAGELAPDEGRVERAGGLRTVVFSQHRASLDPTKTLHEALCPVGDHVDFQGRAIHVSGWARRFLFDVKQLPTPVGRLSGGEQARVLVADLMLRPADLLLLDEPTNDLDIPSLEVLEQSLLEFPGAIVLVTHDRFMLERVATEFVGIDPSGARRFATIAQWERARDAAASTASPPTATTTATTTATSSATAPRDSSEPRGGKRKLSYKEQREYDSMESTILAAEEEVARLEQESASPAVLADHARAGEVFAALATAQQRVRTLYERWAALEAAKG